LETGSSGRRQQHRRSVLQRILDLAEFRPDVVEMRHRTVVDVVRRRRGRKRLQRHRRRRAGTHEQIHFHRCTGKNKLGRLAPAKELYLTGLMFEAIVKLCSRERFQAAIDIFI
jgi:hypothetical protein